MNFLPHPSNAQGCAPKRRQNCALLASAAVLAGLLASPIALGQETKLGKFLGNLNHGLTQVNDALAGKAPLTGSKYQPTRIEAQSTERNVKSEVDVGFPQGRSTERVELFNQALPVVEKTIGVISCMAYGSTEQNARAWNSLHPYEVDHGSVRRPGYAYGTPMAQLNYHDQHLCLDVTKVTVTVPAANAVELEITYLARDSQETVRYSYLYRKNYRNDWQLADYAREES